MLLFSPLFLFRARSQDPRVKTCVLVLVSLFLILQKNNFLSVVFSFFNYFFQYVKERFASQIQEPRAKIQDIPVLFLDSCFLILARHGGE
jgi:hypothetical protein